MSRNSGNLYSSESLSSLSDVLDAIKRRDTDLLNILLQECRVNETLKVDDLLEIIRFICERQGLGRLLRLVTCSYAHELGIRSRYCIVYEDGTREKRFTYAGFFIQQLQFVIDTRQHRDYFGHLLDMAETMLPAACIRNTFNEQYVTGEIKIRDLQHILTVPRQCH